MSRIGRKPIPIPDGVKVNLQGDRVEVEGPKGKLVTRLAKGVRIEKNDSQLRAVPERESRELSPLWGLTRTLVANAVYGVSQGFSKELDIVGIGYRAQVEGKKVVFSLGYSHPIEFDIPDGIKVNVEKQTHITVSGADKHLVGQVAARMRALRKPDPYKQKGVRYVGEHLKKKAGKTGAATS
ncbi:MAG: 50S ribosomal protein L6 [Vicinamibacteria bacterium]